MPTITLTIRLRLPRSVLAFKLFVLGLSLFLFLITKTDPVEIVGGLYFLTALLFSLESSYSFGLGFSMLGLIFLLALIHRDNTIPFAVLAFYCFATGVIRAILESLRDNAIVVKKA